MMFCQAIIFLIRPKFSRAHFRKDRKFFEIIFNLGNVVPYFISGSLKKLDVPGIHSETIASKDGEKS